MKHLFHLRKTILFLELLTRTKCWAHPTFGQKKQQFHQEFDPDGSGELDKKELLRFIAFHVKIAFQNGQKPVTEFNDDDGSLEISDIMRLLETRCQSYLEQFHVLDEDQSGTFGWYVPNAYSYSA